MAGNLYCAHTAASLYKADQVWRPPSSLSTLQHARDCPPAGNTHHKPPQPTTLRSLILSSYSHRSTCRPASAATRSAPSSGRSSAMNTASTRPAPTPAPASSRWSGWRSTTTRPWDSRPRPRRRGRSSCRGGSSSRVPSWWTLSQVCNITTRHVSFNIRSS